MFGVDSTPVLDFTKDYSGPFYLYDLKIVEARARQMQSKLPNVKLHYAMKANYNLNILRCLKKNGLGVDVVSGGEIEQALKAGFSPRDIIFSGVGKTEAEIKLSLEKQIKQLNVESISELVRINNLAKVLNTRMNVVLRLNPNIDIKTHPYIATGLNENKFGIELNQLSECLSIFKESYLILKGISIHLGSQMKDMQSFRMAIKSLKPVYLDLKQQFSTVDTFDFGGGLGIAYEADDLKIENELLDQYAEVVSSELSELKCHLQSEPGRWLVARAGVLVSQTQYIKQTTYKNFVILDSGMNHLIRPTLYQAYHHIMPTIKREANRTYDIVGPICESSDYFAKDRKLTEVKPEDFVVIADTGAYGYSMSNHYNLQTPVQEKFI